MTSNKKGYSNEGAFGTTEQLIVAAVVIVVVLLFGALLWYNYVHRLQELSPEQVFQQAFDDPLTSITELTGDHNLTYGTDYWIRFQSTNIMHLRNAEEFKPTVAEVGRRWFANKWNDYPLHDGANSYQYLQRTRHDVGKAIHEGLLINKKRHYYFYRYWDT